MPVEDVKQSGGYEGLPSRTSAPLDPYASSGMRIRTQLIAAFLLLAIVPLAGIVLYSYASSLEAVRRTAETEAGSLTREMDGRMAAIRAELGRGVERVGEIPLRRLVTAAESGEQGRPDPELGQIVLGGFGEAAPLLRSLELIPAPVPEAAAPESAAPEAGTASPPAEAPPPAPPVPAGAPEAPLHPRAVVIDVSRILEEVDAATREALKAVPPTSGETSPEEASRRAREISAEVLADMAPPPPSPPAVPSAGGSEALSTPESIEEGREEAQAEAARRLAAGAEARARLQEQLQRLRTKALAERERHREAERRNPEAERLRENGLSDERLREDRRREIELSFGRPLEAPVREGGKVVGTVKVRVRGEEVLRQILARTRRGEGEIPFALAADGKLFTIDREDRKKIEALPLDLPALAKQGSARKVLDDWVVVTSKDAESGLTFGIARAVPLEEVRRAAARNFGWGLGLIGLALLGILPLSARMSRDVNLLTEAAERISQGELETRVPVRSKGEMGKLALAFNHMAHDLREHQERLLEGERLRREQELEQRLLKTEYDRKTRELEEARRFQLSLLPKSLPVHPGFEIAVSMRTATEVGGDYYDFHLTGDGVLTAAIGDATGHGARAGTMVTAVKSLFTARAAGEGLSRFLGEAAGVIKRMDLGRMAMALSLIRLEGRALAVSAAGMPPVLLFRKATGRVDEIALPGMPLGGLAFDYQETGTRVEPGDAILLLTDGLPELENPDGEPFGYPRVRLLFEGLGAKSPDAIIAGFTEAADSWAGGQSAKDDMTLVVIKVR
jgi:serine phosphatase RsbU (regulator of sigma subunit)